MYFYQLNLLMLNILIALFTFYLKGWEGSVEKWKREDVDPPIVPTMSRWLGFLPIVATVRVVKLDWLSCYDKNVFV